MLDLPTSKEVQEFPHAAIVYFSVVSESLFAMMELRSIPLVELRLTSNIRLSRRCGISLAVPPCTPLLEQLCVL